MRTLSRALALLVSPPDDTPAHSPFDALCRLAEAEWVEASLLRVATAALGFFPVGTVVELETGQWAVVVGPSDAPEAPFLPRVRLMTDGRGRAVEEPRFADLGDPASGGGWSIARVVPPAEARFNLSAALA